MEEVIDTACQALDGTRRNDQLLVNSDSGHLDRALRTETKDFPCWQMRCELENALNRCHDSCLR